MRKVFVMTALVAGATVSSFGAVSGGYCHSAEYYKQQKKPVASMDSRNLDKEIELERLKLANTLLSGGRATSAKPITEKDLPKNLEDFQADHVDFVRSQAKAKVVKYQHMMGRMYARGEGLPKNEERAAECFRVAYYNYNYEPSGDALRTLIRTGRIQAKDAKEKQRLGL